jgi:hypothetical protein
MVVTKPDHVLAGKRRIGACACLVHMREPYCYGYSCSIDPRSGIQGEGEVGSHEDANSDNIGGLWR